MFLSENINFHAKPGGYEELLTVIKYISARTGRPEKTIVDMIVKIEDYPIFEKIMGEYKNGR